MPVKIIVPAAGQTTDELRLIRWLVRVGDSVKKGQILAELETDKATMELESIAEGVVLKLIGEPDQMVLAGDALLFIGRPGEVIDDGPIAAPQTATPAPTTTDLNVHVDDPVANAEAKANSPANGSGRLKATPAARTMAHRAGIELSGLIGSGPEGCVVRNDVARARGNTSAGLVDRLEQCSPMRRTIAARLQQSIREAPHFCVSMDVDMTRVMLRRAKLNADPAATAKISLNDFMIKAVAMTLLEFPRLNSRLEGDALHYLEEINIGIAVGTDEGLLVPVVPAADRLSLGRIAEEARRLATEARAGRLSGATRGTFTISNLGMYGVRQFNAIINPPECAILAVGAIRETLQLTPTGIVAVPIMTLTLSADHRVVDGMLAAQFLAALREKLESGLENATDDTTTTGKPEWIAERSLP